MGDRARAWLIVVGLLAAACGGGPARLDLATQESSPPDEASPVDKEVAVDGGVLEAFVEEVAVLGLDDVAVQPLPAGSVGPGEPLRVFVRVDAETDTSIRDLVFAGTVATRVDSIAQLGVTGVCGYGWHPDGTRVTEDPCSAAAVDPSVAPGGLVGLTLHPVTEGGAAGPGRYETEVVLDEELGSSLELAVRLALPGEGPLPPWADETIDLRVSLEEVSDGTVDRLSIALVDGYGRVLDETAAADHRDEGSYVVAIPVDVPWRLQPSTEGDNGSTACGGGQIVAYARGDEPRTVILLATNWVAGPAVLPPFGWVWNRSGVVGVILVTARRSGGGRASSRGVDLPGGGELGALVATQVGDPPVPASGGPRPRPGRPPPGSGSGTAAVGAAGGAAPDAGAGAAGGVRSVGP